MYISFPYLRIVLFVLFLCPVFHLKAQSKIPFLMISEMEVSETSEHLQSFLLDRDYFIQSMDSKQTFIQIKIISREKGFLKSDRRYSVNFFVRHDGDSASRIRLQISSEKLEWNGEVGNAVYYYKDEGIVKDSDPIYDDIIAELKQFYDVI